MKPNSHNNKMDIIDKKGIFMSTVTENLRCSDTGEHKGQNCGVTKDLKHVVSAPLIKYFSLLKGNIPQI